MSTEKKKKINIRRLESSLIAGGLKESRSATGLGGPKLGPKLGLRDGGANSTLIDGGAIWEA
jgi:hypothetical protein